jgi:hypothetical protein
VLEYPNRAEDEHGAWCDRAPRGDPLAGIDADEACWAGEEVLPRLDGALCAAAVRHGWTYVGGVADRFARSGWCAEPENGINTTRDSLRKQRTILGPMHPTRAGHAEVGALLADALAPLLDGNPPGSAPCPAP